MNKRDALLFDAGYVQHGVPIHIDRPATVQRIVDQIINSAATEVLCFVSHAHADHLNVFDDILVKLRLKSIQVSFFLGGKPSDYKTLVTDNANPPERIKKGPSIQTQKFMKTIETANYKPIFPSGWFASDLPEGFNGIIPWFPTSDCPSRPLLQILHKGHCNTDELNDRCPVIVLWHRQDRLILSGDATALVTDELQTWQFSRGSVIQDLKVRMCPSDPLEPKQSIVVGCHHGSEQNGSNNDRFVSIVQGTHMVFSAGDTKYRHPNFNVLQRVAEFSSLWTVRPHRIHCGRLNDQTVLVGSKFTPVMRTAHSDILETTAAIYVPFQHGSLLIFDLW